MLTRFALIFLSAFIAVLPCQAQSASVDSLMKFAGNIHQFNSLFPQEKVYIQFDNTSYYTGETIWFKAFVTNASTLGRAQSKILYVDLLSPTGVLLKQEKLKIVAGQADGSFVLMDGSTAQAREKRGVVDYPSGFYEVRAYTSYMLNFSNEILFSRVLAVYDPPKEEGNFYESSPVITIKRSETSEFRPKSEKLRNINASFYPEGGHLIIGKPCRVAFKVIDDTGFGVEATGKVEGKDITFSTVHNGMGYFTFTPQEKRNSVEITVGETSRSFNLPQAEPLGFAMTVDPLDSDSITVKVDGAEGMSGITLGVALTCRGELMDFGTLESGATPSERIIPLHGVPEGVCRIYLFDKNGILYSSRSFYHRSKVIKAPVLEMSADKETYQPFEKITLNFSLNDKGNPFRDRFCLSVRDSRTQNNVYTDDLRTSMLLSSDLKGFIEHPAWYFDSDAPERDQALDLLCLVQGWERYDWDIMTGQKDFSERYRMEESLTLNGWILSSSGRKKLDGVEVNASLVPLDKTLTEIYSYTTDTTGYFGFDIGAEFYDKAKFSISANTDKKPLIGTSARIRIDRPASPAIRPYNVGELVFTGVKGTGYKRKGWKEEEEENPYPTVINIETGYLLPDVDIDEDRMYIDYFTFSAYDVTNDVEIELDKGDYTTDLMGYLIDKGYEVIASDTSIESINGFEPFFYIHDNKKYLYQGPYETPAVIDTKDIKSVIVFDRPMFMMNILQQCPLYQDYLSESIQMLYGEDLINHRLLLVDVQMKEPNEISTREDRFNINKRITTVDGYSRPYSFYSPEYPQGPVFGDVDYRRTLYWNPNVITDENGKAQVEFYNNSITRRFDVEAAGITSAGVPYILDAGF
ncbi:MAG: hypothetical protein IKB00_07410 [Bacteroidaceae bacterium]|nr:hypothetical protein [Bacteroidaceae bacterium]